MSIRLRITLLYTVLVGGILAVFAIFVYYSSANYRSNEFFDRLQERANTTAQVVLVQEDDSSEASVSQLPRRYLRSLPQESLAIFTDKDSAIFVKADVNAALPSNLPSLTLAKGLVEVSLNRRQYLGLRYTTGSHHYAIIVSAEDVFGYAKLDQLWEALTLGWVVALALVALSGWLFALQVLQPIHQLIAGIDRITDNNLSQRVGVGRKDEIGKLANSFNILLQKLQHAFELQASIVAHASHELRTPLTVMRGELEVALMEELKPADYRARLTSILEEVKALHQLTHQLIWLAQASRDKQHMHLEAVRMDELLFATREAALAHYPNRQVEIDYTTLPEEEETLSVLGDEALLRVALDNLLDNAIKYSQTEQIVKITLSGGTTGLVVTLRDEGMGMSPADMEHLYEAFYRGSGKRSAPGHGIGLHLTKRVVDLHGGQLHVNSVSGQGTTVTLTLPPYR